MNHTTDNIVGIQMDWLPIQPFVMSGVITPDTNNYTTKGQLISMNNYMIRIEHRLDLLSIAYVLLVISVLCLWLKRLLSK